MTTNRRFTPALGSSRMTSLYDTAIALFTREASWRKPFAAQIDPSGGDRILDVGCGTGSLAIMLKQCAPGAEIVGLDPDSMVLDRARQKAVRAGVALAWRSGFLDELLADELPPFSKVVSSLVLHQTPIEEKRVILETARRLLVPGGELHVADYGLQRSKLMRLLFRMTVQSIDGVRDTQPNADGIIPDLMEAAGFCDVAEIRLITTPTGSISLYRARRDSGNRNELRDARI